MKYKINFRLINYLGEEFRTFQNQLLQHIHAVTSKWENKKTFKRKEKYSFLESRARIDILVRFIIFLYSTRDAARLISTTSRHYDNDTTRDSGLQRQRIDQNRPRSPIDCSTRSRSLQRACNARQLQRTQIVYAWS